MSPKNPAAVALGRRGGKATAENRTAKQQSDAARKSVEARWAKDKKIIEKSIRTMNESLDRIERPDKKKRTAKGRKVRE